MKFGNTKNTKMKNTDKANQKKTWKNYVRALRQLLHDVPALIPTVFLSAVWDALFPYIEILLSAEILNELTLPNPDKKRAIFIAVLMVVLSYLGLLLMTFFRLYVDVLKYKAMKLVDRSAAVKAWQMDYEILAEPKIHEIRSMIGRWHYRYGLVAIVNEIECLVQAFFTIGISVALAVEFFQAKAVGSGKLAAFLNHWSAPILFLVMFGLTTWYSIWASAKIRKRAYQAQQDSKEANNQLGGLLEACCFEYQRGKDLRLFHAQKQMSEKFSDLYKKLAQIHEKNIGYARIKEVIIVLLEQVFRLLVYLFVGLKAAFHAVGVGSILKYTGMVSQLGDGIRILFFGIQDIYQNGRYINDYYEYLDMENVTARGTLSVTQQIQENYELEFRNVTFTYPGNTVPSLIHVSCKFKKGEKLAVVGPNGSGKSTFIKLLCRLYDPQEGQILLNGVDIREYNYDEYLKLFSTVFQDFQLFAFLLGENVSADSTYIEEKTQNALENAGFGDRLKTLPNGLRTELFNYFSQEGEGVELSGGEKQKVAVARCLYKDAPYAILDEPTAALDPIAEADLYQRMNKFVEAKGAIYISHRLSSCHFCDRILVFQEGKLVQEGTHAELVQEKGLYERMWSAQAKYYQK